MSDNRKTYTDTAPAVMVGLGILNELGKRRKRKERASKTAAASRPAGDSRITIVSSLIKTIAYAALLIAYLVVEVLVAMLAYMYLNLYHIDTFGRLIGFCRYLLNEFAVQLERISPDIANQAYATILGELGAKSILLLFIGLGVSTAIRFLIWVVHWVVTKSVGTVRPQKLQEAESGSAAAA